MSERTTLRRCAVASEGRGEGAGRGSQRAGQLLCQRNAAQRVHQRKGQQNAERRTRLLMLLIHALELSSRAEDGSVEGA